MNERAELLLRAALLDGAASPLAVDDRLPDILGLRFPHDEQAIPPTARARHIAALREHVASRAVAPRRTWLGGFALQQRILWPAFAVAAVAIIILVLLLGRHRFNPDQLVHRPAPQRNLPSPAPHSGGSQGNEQKLVNHPDQGERKTPSPERNQRIVGVPGKEHGPTIQGEETEIGRFTNLMGEPTYRLPGGSRMKALSNKPLYAGATIETGDMDKAELRFGDGTTVAMDFNTKLVLPETKKGVVRPEMIDVINGKVTVHVVHIPQAARTAAIDAPARRNAGQLASNALPFAVKTPVATARVVGTTFSLALVRDKTLKAMLQVVEGKVEFFNEHGSVLAGTRTESTATKDAKPTAPRRLRTLKTFHGPDRGGESDVPSKRITVLERWRQLDYPAGWAGIEASTRADGRVLIGYVYKGTPASAAGLKAGDVVVSMDGKPLADDKRLQLAQIERAGKRIALEVERNGQRSAISFVTIPGTEADLLARVPRSTAKQLDAATWLALTERTDDALKRVLALAKRHPSAAVHNSLGLIYSAKDEMGSAIRNYQAAARLDRTDWRYHFNLGHALMQIGNFPRATEELSKAARLNPKSVDARTKLAWALLIQDRGDDALAQLRAAGTRFDDYPDYWTTQAEVLLHSGTQDEALQAARKAVEIAPFDSNSHFIEAHALHLAGRLLEAEGPYRAALDLNPRYAAARYSLGNLLTKMNRPKDAEQEFRICIGQDPTDAHPHLGLADVLEGMGRQAEAEKEYRAAIGLDAKVANAHVNLSLLLSKTSRSKEAEQELRTAIGLDPASAVAHFNLGIVLGDTGRLPEAEAEYRQAISLDPKYEAPHNNLGNLLSGIGRWTEADSEYRKAIELDTTDNSPHNNLGNLLRDMGRFKEAEAEVRRAIELNPKAYQPHSNLGSVLQKLDRRREAEVELREAIDLDNKAPEPHNDMGNLLSAEGRSREAETEFRTAIQLDPRYALAHNNLAALLQKTGRLTEAESEFRKAIGLDPRLAAAHHNLGNLLNGMGRLKEAEEEFRRAIELDPKLQAAHIGLAEVLENLDRLPAAEAEFRKAIDLDTRAPMPHNNLGNLLSREGRSQEAEAEYRTAIEVAPRYVKGHVNLAVILKETGRLTEAESELRKAIALDPTFALAHSNLGHVLEAMDRLPEAQNEYRKAIEINPSLLIAYNNLAALLDRIGPGPEGGDEVFRAGLKRLPKDPDLLNALAWRLAERGASLDDALDLAKRAVKAAQGDGGILDTLGWVRYKRGEHVQAEEALKEAIKLIGKSPDAADTWTHLGAVYEKRNQIDKAKEAYRKALSIQPKSEEAAAALKRLNR